MNKKYEKLNVLLKEKVEKPWHFSVIKPYKRQMLIAYLTKKGTFQFIYDYCIINMTKEQHVREK